MEYGTVRVLHLLNSPQRRGAEVFAAHLASCTQDSGRFESLICTLYRRDDDGLPAKGVPEFHLGGREGLVSRIGLDPGLLYRLCGLLRRFRPELLVAHGGDTLKYAVAAGFFYRQAATIYRNIGTASAWANSPVKVKLNRALLGRVDTVASISQAVMQDFIDVYDLPPHRVALIPNGVATADFDPGAQADARRRLRGELGLSPQDVALISVGSLSPEKGYQDLLPVLGELRSGGFRHRLLLVGDGPLREKLRQQACELGLEGQMEFLGRRSDVPQLMAAADLFVLPSRTEGMPGVLIEAGMAGLPSVAFDVGGVAEVVDDGETGFLIPPGDLGELARGLNALAGDPQRRAAMGETARTRCLRRFDMRQVADQFEELFLDVLGAARERERVRS